MTALTATAAVAHGAHNVLSRTCRPDRCQTSSLCVGVDQQCLNVTPIVIRRVTFNRSSNAVIQTKSSWTVGQRVGKQRREGGKVRSAEGAADITEPTGGVSADANEQFRAAAKSGDLRLCQELLASGKIDMNRPSPDKGGWTALQLSVFYLHPELAEFLLDNGADVDGRNASGNTALQFACIKSDVRLASLLIYRGADVFAQSNDKGTAIDYAEEWGGEEIVNFIHLKATQISQMRASK